MHLILQLFQAVLDDIRNIYVHTLDFIRNLENQYHSFIRFGLITFVHSINIIGIVSEIDMIIEQTVSIYSKRIYIHRFVLIYNIIIVYVTKVYRDI